MFLWLVFFQILLIRLFRKLMFNEDLLVIMGFQNHNDNVSLEILFELYLIETLFRDFVRKILMIYAREMRKNDEYFYQIILYRSLDRHLKSIFAKLFYARI
ncbi:hypothetical protein MANES_02G049150v8 [Manihot esculenta]|uniref:Uncharacterized protein n=1 Tax=Manihot esculenta TaxID=3983 RepID=A0ACB7I5S8_MANES|nr:hypothetical protein MANES_02G049150v8 [Manihot esculenta]